MPPLLKLQGELFSPKQNAFYQHADVQLFLAYKDGRIAGRLSAHIDHEVLIGSWWGYSERAEHDFAVAAREEWGPGHVDEDLDNFYNANGLHADIDDGESHMWDNDKYATFVDVP